MKTLLTLFFICFIFVGANAQLVSPINFEVTGDTATWTVFANGTAELNDFVVVENPAKNEVNPTDSCLQFVIHDNADPWAGAFSDAFGAMEFTEENHIISMLVYKTKISPVVMKVEVSPNGGANTEIKVENTLTEEWEKITFDFTSVIGKIYTRITFFPDFPSARTEGGGVMYIDKITSPNAVVGISRISGNNLKVFPNPVEDVMYVDYPGMTGINVSNVLGQSIRSFSFQKTDKKTIDLSDLRSGFYFVTTHTSSGDQTTKFFKK